MGSTDLTSSPLCHPPTMQPQRLISPGVALSFHIVPNALWPGELISEEVFITKSESHTLG